MTNPYNEETKRLLKHKRFMDYCYCYVDDESVEQAIADGCIKDIVGYDEELSMFTDIRGVHWNIVVPITHKPIELNLTETN